MNSSLSDFLDKAQLPAFLALIAAVLRVCLSAGALAPGETYGAGVVRKVSIVFGSVLTGVVAAYLAESHASTSGWAMLLSIACSFSAQDICMRLTKRIPTALDIAEQQFDRRFPHQSNHPTDDHDTHQR